MPIVAVVLYIAICMWIVMMFELGEVDTPGIKFSRDEPNYTHALVLGAYWAFLGPVVLSVVIPITLFCGALYYAIKIVSLPFIGLGKLHGRLNDQRSN